MAKVRTPLIKIRVWLLRNDTSQMYTHTHTSIHNEAGAERKASVLQRRGMCVRAGGEFRSSNGPIRQSGGFYVTAQVSGAFAWSWLSLTNAIRHSRFNLPFHVVHISLASQISTQGCGVFYCYNVPHVTFRHLQVVCVCASGSRGEKGSRHFF
jgi:hypothetical protein